MKAILVFCEGRHDVVFTQRSLGVVGGCRWVDGKIRDLPSPFGHSHAGRGLIATHIDRYAVSDLTLQTATHPRLPTLEAVLQSVDLDTVFFLFRAHGKDQTNPIVDFLDKVKTTMEIAGNVSYDVSQYAIALLHDANEIGVAGTLDNVRQRYRTHYGDLAELRHGMWMATDMAPVGCFVFSGDAEDTGTLEDHLRPMVEGAWPDRYAQALDFIDANGNPEDRVSRSLANRTKAGITIAGQFSCPGAPMSVVIGREGLPKTAFEESPASRALVDFLTSVPWEPALDAGDA